MFGLFKKKSPKASVELYSICDGTFKKIEQVNDVVFSEKVMGDGFAVTPKSGKVSVCSPVKGKILSVFPTKHAITIETVDGIEVIVHMGIDTVELQGEGFDIHIAEGQDVDQNTVLAIMDTDLITSKEKVTDIIIVFPNLEDKNQHLDIPVKTDVLMSESLGYIID